MNNPPPMVYVVDDDESIRQSLARLLRSAGIGFRVFASGAEFLYSMPLEATGCLLLDLHMPEMDGLKLLAVCTERFPNLRVTMITAHADAISRAQAMSNGATAYLSKPFDCRLLLEHIQVELAGSSH